MPPTVPFNHRGTWRTYTTAEGLAGLQAEHIGETDDGFLWISTWNSGISRFDGEEFRTFTRRDGLCGDQVMVSHLDNDGNLIFGTLDGGACLYDGKKFTVPNGFPSTSVTFIYPDQKGRLWFGGSHTLGYWYNGQYHDLVPLYRQSFGMPPAPYLPLQCWGIAEDAQGLIFIGGEYLVSFDGQTLQRHDQLEGCPEPGLNYSVCHRPDGGLWIGGQTLATLEDGRFEAVPLEFSGFIRKIRLDRQGRSWFCICGDGAVCHDGNHYHHLTETDGLAYKMVNDVWEDREGHLWFATWGGGINCYDPLSIQVFSQKDGLPHNEISTVVEDRRGYFWIGFVPPVPLASHPESLGVFDGEEFTFFGPEHGLDSEGTLALHEDSSGVLWIGTFTGLMCWRDGAFERLDPDQGFSGCAVSAIAEDEEGTLYLGHRSPDHSHIQVSRFVAGRFELLFSSAEDSFSNAINTILPTRRYGLCFALGTRDGLGEGRGLGLWDAKRGVRFFTEDDGLTDNRVQSLCEDGSHDLWIATLAGVSRYDGHRFTAFTNRDSLSNNHVWCLYRDRGGSMWLGSDGGMMRHDGHVFQTIRSSYIGPSNAIVEDRRGHFWFATLQGLVRYQPNTLTPRARMTQVIADRIYSGEAPLHFSTSTPQAIFEYKGLSFRTHPRQMLYTSRLKGFDADWNAPTHELRAHYAHLPPGDYTFEVRAIDRDLNYSSPSSVEIKVLPDSREDRIGALEDILVESQELGPFIGRSAAMRQVMSQISTVAETDMSLLILGETGTGKSLAARAIHRLSNRRSGPFIQVNCGAIPDGLVESELFGHEKGAFTGAQTRKIGRFELADGGTLFLDEIGDLPPASQQVLLQVLQERILTRVGGTHTVAIDVRVIAATNRDLRQAMGQGIFREDLYYRLSVFVLSLPPLRQRLDDIEPLGDYFIEHAAREFNRPPPVLTPEATDHLHSYAWPGNVRELDHLLQRAVLVCRDGVIRPGDIPIWRAGEEAEGEEAQQEGPLMSLEENEKRLIRRALEACDGVVYGNKGAARLLDVHPEKLRTRMRKYDIGKKRR
jgi:DNA-binding NtrC family response regulator/streptogramin lyase